MIPLLPLYAEKLGASPTVAGLLISSYAICQLISGPLLGRLSDTMGRKPILIISQIGTLVGFLLTAMSSVLWVVFLGRMIDGATAGNLTIAQAYISDVTKPEDRAKSFGVIGIAFGLGFLIGPAISGFLSTYDYRYPMYAAAFMSATSILATTFLLPSVPTAAQKAAKSGEAASGSAGPGGKRLSLVQWGEYGRYFKQPGLATLLLQFLVFAFSFSMFVGGFPLFAERAFTWKGVPFGPAQTGYMWAYAGFLGIFLQGPGLGRMVRKFGERRLNRVGFAAYVAGYAALAFARNIPMLILATTILAIGGLVRPTLTSLITHSTSREEQGVVLGLTQSLTSISQICAPPLAGFLIGHHLLTGWGLGASAIAFIGLMMAGDRQPEPATAQA
jgi:MFS family permease